MKKSILKIISIIFIAVMVGLYWQNKTEIKVVSTESYTIQRGDTLWDIADKRTGSNMDNRKYIGLMYKHNKNLSPYINPGQTIILPVLESLDCCSVKATSIKAKYTTMDAPSINSSCKRWMDYRKITNKNSPQYKFVNKWGWSDINGFMRCYGERDLGINDDYYMIALGSYYGTSIGTKYRITTDSGNVFYGVLADRKADVHTNSTHQYTNKKNPDVVEFLVDTTKLNSEVRRMGNANVYMPLNGSITKIERIEFKEG